MPNTLVTRAHEIMCLLKSLTGVCECSIYGSIANGSYDTMSDIDIEIDVSGTDNGQFMLTLPDKLGQLLPICYYDFAPSLAPDKYVISISIDENDPFAMVDICCSAVPHHTTVTRAQLSHMNDQFAHTIKLWTANLKHHARGADCRGDIEKMAKRLGIEISDIKTNAELLYDTMIWLEANAPEKYAGIICSCRRCFNEFLK